MSPGEKGGAFCDRFGLTTAASTRALTGIDSTATAESLELTTLMHGRFFPEKNVIFYPKPRALECANGEFSLRSQESDPLIGPVVKKSLTKAYILCGKQDVIEGGMTLPPTNDSAPSIGSDLSSLSSSLPDSFLPLYWGPASTY